MLGPDGAVRYIIHRVEDVTDFVLLQREGVEQGTVAEELRDRTVRLRLANEELTRELAERSLNLHKVGGQGLVALGRLVEDATCSRSGWVGGDGWLHVLRAAAWGLDPGRTGQIEARATLRGPR